MENSNAKVYLQYELEVAGFDPDLLVEVSGVTSQWPPTTGPGVEQPC